MNKAFSFKRSRVILLPSAFLVLGACSAVPETQSVGGLSEKSGASGSASSTGGGSGGQSSVGLPAAGTASAATPRPGSQSGGGSGAGTLAVGFLASGFINGGTAIVATLPPAPQKYNWVLSSIYKGPSGPQKIGNANTRTSADFNIPADASLVPLAQLELMLEPSVAIASQLNGVGAVSDFAATGGGHRLGAMLNGAGLPVKAIRVRALAPSISSMPNVADRNAIQAKRWLWISFALNSNAGGSPTDSMIRTQFPTRSFQNDLAPASSAVSCSFYVPPNTVRTIAVADLFRVSQPACVQIAQALTANPYLVYVQIRANNVFNEWRGANGPGTEMSNPEWGYQLPYLAVPHFSSNCNADYAQDGSGIYMVGVGSCGAASIVTDAGAIKLQ